MENGWANEDPRVILAIIIGIAVVVIWSIKTHRTIAHRSKVKEDAIKNNQVIKAKIVKHWIERNSKKGKQNCYHGVYEYMINGETRKYSIHSDYGIPMIELNLYYDESSNKFFSDYDHENLSYNVGILLGIAALLLTLFFTGYIGLGPLHI